MIGLKSLTTEHDEQDETREIRIGIQSLLIPVLTRRQNDLNMSEEFNLTPLDVEQYKLENGLRVVLNRDDAVPVVALAVYYDVGSRNERADRTGFAHLFEHMMFQGSENVKKAEHFQYIMKAGGTMNGTTSSERTNYFETFRQANCRWRCGWNRTECVRWR